MTGAKDFSVTVFGVILDRVRTLCLRSRLENYPLAHTPAFLIYYLRFVQKRACDTGR